jgi:hypothetical protein
MISFAEFEIALLGLLRLARFDARFAGFFDLSRDGARRSFRLAFWLLPIVLFLMHLNANWPDGTDMVRVVLGELIGYSLSWTCFSLLLLSVAKLIDRQSRIYGAIAIYNWITVLAIALQLPVSIAAYYGLDPSWAGGLADVALLFVTACEFFAFRRVLDLRIELTIALVAVDFVLSRMLELLTYGLSNNTLF